MYFSISFVRTAACLMEGVLVLLLAIHDSTETRKSCSHLVMSWSKSSSMTFFVSAFFLRISSMSKPYGLSSLSEVIIGHLDRKDCHTFAWPNFNPHAHLAINGFSCFILCRIRKKRKNIVTSFNTCAVELVGIFALACIKTLFKNLYLICRDG